MMKIKLFIKRSLKKKLLKKLRGQKDIMIGVINPSLNQMLMKK